jgi:hypothetical protein
VIADDDRDPMLDRIGPLTVLAPDEPRAARLRARCRAKMQRASRPRRALGPALFTGLCLLYLWALAVDVLRLRGRL